MTHAGRCSLCFSRQGKHSLGLPFLTIKIVSMDKPKSNRLCGIFKMPLSSLFWLTARVLRSSFERQTNQRCLIPLVKAIRVRGRLLDSLVARDPDHFFAQPRHSDPASLTPVLPTGSLEKHNRIGLSAHGFPLWVPPP